MKLSYFLKKLFSYFCSFSLAYTCATASAGTVDEFIEAWNDSTTSEFVLSEDYSLELDGDLGILTKTFTLTGELSEDGSKPTLGGRYDNYWATLVVAPGAKLILSNVSLIQDPGSEMVNGGIYVDYDYYTGSRGYAAIDYVDFIGLSNFAGLYGAAVCNNGSIYYIRYSTFDSCTNPGYDGGAYGSLSGYVYYYFKDTTFTNNSTTGYLCKGGAIYNGYLIGYGYVGIIDCEFTGNLAGYKAEISDIPTYFPDDWDQAYWEVDYTIANGIVGGQGGAIWDMSGYIGHNAEYSITGTSFEANVAVSGGAIYARSGVDLLKLDDCQFVDNMAVYRGGAIYNVKQLYVTDSDFTGNSVVLEEDVDTIMRVYDSESGVSLMVDGVSYATLADYYAEHKSDIPEWVDEGSFLIYGINNGTIVIDGVEYDDYMISVSSYYDSVEKEYKYSSFIYVNAEIIGQGGAIFNDANSVLYVGAVDSDVTFNGNTADTNAEGVAQGEAIYNSSGSTTYLFADNGKTLTFNDNIYSESGTIISINDNINDILTGILNHGQLDGVDYTGTVSFNAGVDGAASITMYNGTVAFGHAVEADGSYSYGNINDGASFTVSGGTAISTKDSLVHSALLGALTLEVSVDLYLDVDLASATGDVLMGATVASGTGYLNLTDINLLSAGEESEIWVQIADTNISNVIVLTEDSYSLTLDGVDYEEYSVDYVTKDDGGYLVFTQLVKKNLKYWVNLEEDLKYYTLEEDELCDESIGALLDDASLEDGDGLVVEGQGNKVVASGENITGITIDDKERYITFNDVASLSGFEGNAIDSTTGVVTINAIQYDSTWDNGIKSNHELYLNASGDKTITFNAAITGTGSVTINGEDEATGKIVMNASLSNDKIELVQGSLVMNAAAEETVQLQGEVTGEGSLVINETGTGTIELDGDISTATVDLNAGTLSLTQSSSITGSDWTSEDGSTLDLANGSTENVLSLGEVTLNGTTNLALDIDLWNVTADTITAESVTVTEDGQLLISEINIIADSKEIPLTTVTIADEELRAYISLSDTLTVTCSNGADESYANYFITYDQTTGDLSFSYADINTAFSSEVPQKLYVMLGDESALADLGLMGGKDDAALLEPTQEAILTISGNGHSISGNGFAGATIEAGTNLVINDVAEWSDFDGPIFTNDGTISINSINNELSVINGSIAANEGTGKLELNKDEAAEGQVQLGDVSGQEATLYRGTALLEGTFTDGIFNLDGGVLYLATTSSTTDSVALNANGGTLDVYDGVLSDYTFESLNGVDSTTEACSTFSIDVDIINQTADTFTADSFSGDLVLYLNPIDNLEQFTDEHLSGEIEIFTLAEGSEDSLEDFNFFPESGNYLYYTPTAALSFCQHDDPDKLGWIKYELETGLENTLATTITDVADYRIYSMGYDETAGGGDMNDYGDMKILGNGYTIIDGGFSVLAGKTMTVVNANMDEASDIVMGGDEEAAAQLVMDNDGADVQLAGKIEGSGADNNSVTLQGEGSFTLANEVSGVELLISDSLVIVEDDAYLGGTESGDASNVVNLDGAQVSLANGTASDIYIAGMSLVEGTNTQLAVDVDLASISMDRFFSMTDVSAGGTLEITTLNILSDAAADVTYINFTTDSALMSAIVFEDLEGVAGVSSVYNYLYDISYDETSGDFVFTRTSQSFNPDVYAGSVASQGAYSSLLAFYEQVFTNYDMFISKNQAERKDLEDASKGYNLWLLPASAYGNVVLENGLKVEEFSWGAYMGIDSSIKHLASDWRAIYSAYAGYMGLNQQYENVEVKQNGGLGGLSGLLYKKNFWTSVAASAGGSSAKITTGSGSDDLSFTMAGIASKTGYNIEMSQGDYVLQPNVQLSYSYVSGLDYTSSSGVKMNVDDLSVFQVMPGVRLISNRSRVWQPYASVQMVWNYDTSSSSTANGELLPDLGIKPYVQYGVGSQYRVNDHFVLFGQVMVRSGGRQGVSMTLGFNWDFN